MKTRKKCIKGIVALAIIGIIATSGLPTAAGFGHILPDSSESEYDKCLALVVGISNYEGREHDDPWRSSTRDANEFRRQLKKSPGLTKIKLLMDRAATELAIDTAFADISAKAGPNDIVIVYLTGESDESDEFNRALMTYDLQPYTPNKLAEKLNNIDAGVIVVIIDCCYVGVYKEELDGIDGLVVLMSSQADELVGVYEYSDPLTSYHTAFLYWLNRVPDKADADNNGLISVKEAFDYASYMTVINAAKYGQSQHPIIMRNNCPEPIDFLPVYSNPHSPYSQYILANIKI